MKALIVEDQQVCAEFLAEFIERRLEVSVYWKRVETAEEMAKALEERKWDVVFADCVMPNFSGAEAWKMFKSSEQDCPFLFISGVVDEKEVEELLNDGVDGFISKSAPEQLIVQLRRYVQRVSSEIS